MKKYNLKKVILIILDGFGLESPGPGNPVTAKNMPFLNNLVLSYRASSLVAAGLVVGLEWGTYGNSEVGHGAIGTGRVTVQSLARINTEIKDGKFFKNEAFLEILKHVKTNHSKVHLIGCVSLGGIHSHEGHLVGLLNFFTENNFKDVYVHMITDGEDSAPQEGIKSLERIKKASSKTGAKIASISGRNYAMDRVRHWSLTKKVWDVMVHGDNKQSKSAEDYIKEFYKKEIYDADIVPATFSDSKGESVKIEDGDGLIFFNFRNDRMKQLVASFVSPDFKDFDRGEVPENLAIATMTNYSNDFKVLVAYPPQIIADTLGEVISKKGLTQLRIAESEKETHVTNFFDGGKLDSYPGEERIIIASRALLGKEYLEHPEMATGVITDNILKNINKPYGLMVINFANTDMMAHTGNMPAIIKALSVVDKMLEKIIKSTNLSETAVIITADHGNAEEMITPDTNKPDTQHSTANVPIIFVTETCGVKNKKTEETLDNLYKENTVGSLIDVAPTILNFLGIEKPKKMTGSSLVN